MNDKDSILLSEAYGSMINANQAYLINGEEAFYTPEVDEEEDNRKIWHYFKNKEGKEIADFDFSPYETPNPEVINFWIKLGCPSRNDIRTSGAGNGIAPIDIKDLQNYAKIKV